MNELKRVLDPTEVLPWGVTTRSNPKLDRVPASRGRFMTASCWNLNLLSAKASLPRRTSSRIHCDRRYFGLMSSKGFFSITEYLTKSIEAFGGTFFILVTISAVGNRGNLHASFAATCRYKVYTTVRTHLLEHRGLRVVAKMIKCK